MFLRSTPLRHSHESGFVLLEVCFALIIVGLICHFGVQKYLHIKTHQMALETKQHQEFLLRLVAHHYKVTKQLPEPILPQGGYGPCESGVCKGIFPYQKFGLPQKMAKDAYGHYFTYIIHKEQNVSPLGLKIQDYREEDRDPIPVRVIFWSHGKNGYGAYQQDGSHLYTTITSDRENTALARTPISIYPYSLDPETYFDDIVTYAAETTLWALTNTLPPQNPNGSPAASAHSVLPL